MSTNTANNTIHPTSEVEETLSVQDLLELFARNWKWFILSLSCALGVAVLYLLVKQPEYSRSASILIKEDKAGGGLGGEIDMFSNMGLFQSNVKVQNELITIQSPVILSEVVRRLHLNIDYSTRSGLRRETLYGASLPIKVQLLEEPTEAIQFSVNLEEGRVHLSDFVLAGEKLEGSMDVAIGDTIDSPVGRMVLVVNEKVERERPSNVQVTISRIGDTSDNIQKELLASLVDEKASVIKLSYIDVSAQRAEDILGAIIEVYNELWLEDKNQVAVSTSRFINERLAVIEQDLGVVDGDISSFKSRNLLPSVSAVTDIVLEKSKESEAQLLVLNNQLAMAKYVRTHLGDVRNADRLLPANSGIGVDKIESQISEYNELLINRNRLKANSSADNPLVVDMDAALLGFKSAISTSLDNAIVSLNTQIASLERNEQKNTARIASSPDQAKYLLSIERQQKIKEALYLFLLQKREENELTQAFSSYNTRVITPPIGSRLPTTPISRNVLLVAIALGLLLPAGVLFAKESLNTKVRGRKDTESLSLPYVGDIPDFRTKGNLSGRLVKVFRRSVTDNQVVRPLMVRAGGGDIANEAFRVVRTNLEFMLQSEGKQIVMLSSINPDSGKTFICMNLATSFVLKGQRVAVIDLDIRRALLSLYIGRPKVGVSNYLNGNVDSLSEISYKHPDVEGLNIIPVGMIPPNPAELLVSPRLTELFEKLRQEYDYIFIDCPPAEIVADASIINTHVDMTLFVVRVGLLERAMLPEIERFYREDKYRNMAYILNGTNSSKSKYGYNYGYGSYMRDTTK